MFDIGFSKIIVIFGLALVVLGPEKLPRVAATVGRWVGRARVMAKQFRDQLEQESEGLRKETDGLREAAEGLRRDLDPNASAAPAARPMPSPSPAPMMTSTAASAEPVAIPDPAAPAMHAPLHSDSPEVNQEPPAPTPVSPAPTTHEPGT